MPTLELRARLKTLTSTGNAKITPPPLQKLIQSEWGLYLHILLFHITKGRQEAAFR